MRLQDCDYVLDKKARFFIIKKGGKKIYGSLVFKPNKDGERINKILDQRYSKVITQHQGLSTIKKKDIKKVFRPRECFKENYSKLPELWKKVPDALISSGVNKSEIGIFGSYLIGFDNIKDIDFVVYGADNCRKIMQHIKNIRNLVGAKKISKKHIKYQAKKYGMFLSKQNDLEKLLKNKWSSLQFSHDILNTIRFVYKSHEAPKDTEIKNGKTRIVKGIVVDDFGTNFVPRIFSVKLLNKKVVRVLTYFWAYQACVKKGQKVIISGEYNKKSNTLYLSKRKHWIKIVE